MNRRALLIALAVLGLAAVLAFAVRNQRALERGLPPRIVTKSEAEARALAGPGCVAVLGTGSMAPFIPASKPGLDPFVTICGFVVLQPGATVEDVKTGALCVYSPDWAGRSVLHQAASFSDGGWIMTGLHNKGYENKERMTGRNFIGLVARVYIWE